MIDDDVTECHEQMRKDIKKAANSRYNGRIHYKLGEVIANGVRYFGQETRVQQGQKKVLTAMCICPECGETWRVIIANVRSGNSKACCKSNRSK